ncbi:hypothetical protein BYT27DRAFT_6396271 [Phlegmacium glaucopus]|nr:hypothetical protein BYT27DRAFT_6396271 [Phlegmacium glaucopus]
MQQYAEQLIQFPKSSSFTAPLNLHLPLPSNGHLNHNLISNPSSTQPSQPHPSSTSLNKQLQETIEGSVSRQPSAVHPHPPTSASNWSSSHGTPKRPSDALCAVPAPVLPNHSSAYHTQMHVPVYSHLRSNVPLHSSSSSLNSHSSSHLDPHSLLHYRSQPQLHSQSQQQHDHHQSQHQLRQSHHTPSSSSTCQDMDEPDPDTDTEDADTSTDAGTETDGGSETDEEPTIRAPPTVAGSVGSGASVGGGSVWGDEGDERMASP